MPEIAQFMHDYNIRSFGLVEPPVMKPPVVEGTAGTATVTYKASFVTLVGETTPSEPVTIATAPNTLNAFDKVRLEVDSIPLGTRKVRYYKSTVSGFKLLGEVDPVPGRLFDQGQAVGTGIPATANTSGRPQYRAIGFHPGQYAQRQEWMDLQGIFGKAVKDIADRVNKDGDIIEGLVEQDLGSNEWNFVAGIIYYAGLYHLIPEGAVTLTGTGKEIVGLVVTEQWVTPDSDAVLRASADEGVPPEYAMQGADRLEFSFVWGVDQPGAIKIREFLNGAPLREVAREELTGIEKKIAESIFDVSGDFVVRNFPSKMVAHATDNTKVSCVVGGGGKAYVIGRAIATIAPQPIDIPKGRDVKSVNGSILSSFSIPGGSVLGSNTETFNVSGLAIKLKIGDGNYHTVTLSGTGQTASQVATQISASVNAYPTSVPLVTCLGANGKVQITAASGKSLVIATVASDAYTILGISTGTYLPAGQRIYECNNLYIKQTSDLTYLTEVVEAVTHDGTDHIDALTHENVQDIVGASNTLLDCHDGKYDYVKNVDFEKNGNQIDFAALGGSDPANGATYYVKYRYNHNAVKGTRVRVRVVDAQVVKGAEDSQDTLVFTGGTATEVISGNPVAGLSGNAQDVISILRVNNTAGLSQTQYDSYALSKNSTALAHADSQIDWSAAGAQGALPGGQPSTGATYYVTYEYWRHTVEGDYVSAESYLNDYPSIEMAPNGTWYLRDCVDFRCVGGSVPLADDSPRLDYDFYLSRIDKIVLGPDGYFARVAGAPAESPKPPVDQTGVLPVLRLSIPPYTYAPGDVVLQTLEMQRKTQVGINELAAKIERLEYYAAMKQLQDTAIQNTAATDAKGIFSDALLGAKSCDVHFDKNGIFFSAAIDPTEQCLRLPASEDGQALTVDEANSSGIAKVGKVIVFDYQESVLLSQLKASSTINVNPYQVYGWIGTLELNPEADFWTDILQAPVIDTNYDSQMEQLNIENAARARSATWGAWRLTWDASNGWADKTMGEAAGVHWSGGYDASQANAARERYGTYKSLVPERQLVEVDDRVVDVTVLPFLRTKLPNDSPFEIGLTIHGLLPSIDAACTIDGVVVALTPTGSSVAGASTYQGKATVRTSAAGGATAKFTVPSGITVGAKEIKVFSASEPELTYAISVFTSQGFRETHQKTVYGIMSITERDAVAVQTEFHYGDPLAQTFAVESGTRWISGVRLFLQSKDAALPITVEIRQTLNGQPTRTVLQSKTLYPASVNVSDDATVATDFIFPNIIGYTAGEYCFVIIANCETYNLWHAVMGEVDLRTSQLIRQQPTDGVEFRSPNNSYWQGYPDCDLAFEIMESNFENNCQVAFTNINGIQAGALCAAITQFLPAGCDLHWSYSLNNGGDWIPFVPGIDTELSTIATQVQLRADVTGSGGTFQIAESGAGIILLLNDLNAEYIGYNAQFSDPCDKVTMIADLAVDGTNGTGTRTVTPYYSTDDGLIWVELKKPAGYAPIAIGDGTYDEYQFETPAEATVQGATNATPIVISSTGHLFQENALVTIASVGGNTAANGTFRAKNVTTDTLELTDPTTGANIAGNGAYTSGGTMKLADFTQLRFRIRLVTGSRAVTPKVRRIRGIAA